MRILPLAAALALLPLAAAQLPAENDCGLGHDANFDVVVPPLACEGSWLASDETDVDNYLFHVEAGDIVRLAVTPESRARDTHACLAYVGGGKETCGAQLPTMLAQLQSSHEQRIEAATALGRGSPPGSYRYQLELHVTPAPRATQVEEGRFEAALAILTPDFDIPVVPEETQRAEVRLAAPMRPGQEILVSWDRDVPILDVDLYRETPDGPDRAQPDCERDVVGRTVRCRADDWDAWAHSSPVDLLVISMPVGLELRWRVEYDHWLDAAPSP